MVKEEMQLFIISMYSTGHVMCCEPFTPQDHSHIVPLFKVHFSFFFPLFPERRLWGLEFFFFFSLNIMLDNHW